MGEIEVTNHGPGDVYELDVTADSADDMISRTDELPVPKLPQGKSVRVMRIARTMASRTGSYLYLTATAKTVDGMPINAELFVSGV